MIGDSIEALYSTTFYVVKIDVKWFMKDRDKVVDGQPVPPDMSIEEPNIVDEFSSESEAKQKADALNSTISNDETVDIDLSNGQHYSGRRYYYTYYQGH